MFIPIAMIGFDQEMMQKNISVDNIRNSQKKYACLLFYSFEGECYLTVFEWFIEDLF